MVGILSLWLPILLAGVAVFLTSSVVHMVLPHHRKDFQILPDENGVMEALRRFDLPPGDYLTPCSHAGMDAMKNPAFREKADAGPLIVMTVLPKGAFTQGMGKTMAVWFLFCALGQWLRSIWYRASWATTLKSTADAFLFGLMTAGVFGWLWPA